MREARSAGRRSNPADRHARLCRARDDKQPKRTTTEQHACLNATSIPVTTADTLLHPMHPLVRSGLFAFCVLTAPAVFTAETKPPPPPIESGPAVKVSIAGNYAGMWKGSGESAGKLRLKLKQDGESWTGEATFTF